MNVRFLPRAALMAAAMTGLPIKYPWPVGTFAHASFLASFICNAPPDALLIFVPAAAASQRQHLKDYRTVHADCIVAVLINTIYTNGTRCIDLENVLSYALILLLRFRKCRPAQHPVGVAYTMLWTTIAQLILRIPGVELRHAEMVFMEALQWRTWVKDEDIHRFQHAMQLSGYFGRNYLNDAIP
ncbi:hypothetical protein ST47_g10419 [Ascochyta rabiei]|uniref:Uncharacterized protein n=1 Tax=Didymella rabiei TaxID=5454 RepID=A0A162VHJ6_DIDRA|nr:hypothetical protein ST47_g10419 [Ascochyta rabiei]